MDLSKNNRFSAEEAKVFRKNVLPALGIQRIEKILHVGLY